MIVLNHVFMHALSEGKARQKRFQKRDSFMKTICILFLLTLGWSPRFSHLQNNDVALPPKEVSFPTPDGGVVYAHLYGSRERAVVLAHGGRFTKESWEPQAQQLVKAGFRVLAIDFRGRGKSRGGTQTSPTTDGVHFDVLAAVRYLRQNGPKSVSVIGASFGGGAAAEAATQVELGEIDRLVLLAHSPIAKPELMKGRKLFILARDDFSGDNQVPRLPKIRDQFERAPQPKKMVLLDGSAHAQFLFETEQGDRLMREMLRFLTER